MQNTETSHLIDERSPSCFGILSLDNVQDIAIGAAVAAASAYVCMRVWRYIRESMREKPPPNVYLQAAIAELRGQAATPYDSNNAQHEAMLMKLWALLKPREPLASRHTRQWGNIGFQGSDPATDFRAMGLLGLKTLLYFAQNHTENARYLVEHMEQPSQLLCAYPFAIAAINIASDLIPFLEENTALGNEIFIDGSLSPFVRFAELFSVAMMQFDMFNVSFLQNYLQKGGIRELAVMQFNESRKQFFASRLQSTAAMTHPEYLALFGRVLRLRALEFSYIDIE